MFAREGTSWGASSWWGPCRERKAIGIGLEEVGEGWCRIWMGEEGVPQGVVTLMVATRSKCGSFSIPWREVSLFGRIRTW